MTGGTTAASLPTVRVWPWPATAALPTPAAAAPLPITPVTRGSKEGATWRLRVFMSVEVISETRAPTGGRSNDMGGRGVADHGSSPPARHGPTRKKGKKHSSHTAVLFVVVCPCHGFLPHAACGCRDPTVFFRDRGCETGSQESFERPFLEL